MHSKAIGGIILSPVVAIYSISSVRYFFSNDTRYYPMDVFGLTDNMLINPTTVIETIAIKIVKFATSFDMYLLENNGHKVFETNRCSTWKRKSIPMTHSGYLQCKVRVHFTVSIQLPYNRLKKVAFQHNLLVVQHDTQSQR